MAGPSNYPPGVSGSEPQIAGQEIYCEWFALCVNQAAGTVDHPILGEVPTCQRCADRFELTLAPL